MNARPTPEELKQILAEHHAWCHNQGGKQADLAGADLRKADLTEANLTAADLTGADLRKADLARANFTGANLTRVNLTEANLTRANLTGVDLTGVDLTGGDLTKANLTRVNLTGSNLSQVIGIQVAACHWTGHGERGRLLNAVELPSGLHFYCGCFSGNEKELREYITNGDPNLIGSRTRTLDFLLGCF